MFKLFLLLAALLSIASAACATEGYVHFTEPYEIPYDLKVHFDTCYGLSWNCPECPMDNDCGGMYLDECMSTLPNCIPNASFMVSNGSLTIWPYDPTCTTHSGVASYEASKGTVNGVFAMCAMRMFNATVAAEQSLCIE